MKAGAARLLALLVLMSYVAEISSCCCSWTQGSNPLNTCGCNVFNCDCDTDNGFCKRNWISWIDGLEEFRGCVSTREVCSAKRRRRAVGLTMELQASPQYSRLYENIIGMPDLEVFYGYDLDKDGFISFDEAAARNMTNEDFKSVDTNNDGLIVPSEYDSSLSV